MSSMPVPTSVSNSSSAWVEVVVSWWLVEPVANSVPCSFSPVAWIAHVPYTRPSMSTCADWVVIEKVFPLGPLPSIE